MLTQVETDPMIGHITDEYGKPLILYFRGYDKELMMKTARKLLSFVTKLNIVETNPNEYCGTIEYKIYILESDVDKIVEAFEKGELRDHV